MPCYTLTFDVTLYRVGGVREFRPQHFEVECPKHKLDAAIAIHEGSLRAFYADRKIFARVIVRCVITSLIDESDESDGDEGEEWKMGSEPSPTAQPLEPGEGLKLDKVSTLLVNRAEAAFHAIGHPFLFLAWKIRWLNLLGGENQFEGEVQALESLLSYRAGKFFEESGKEQDRPLGYAIMKVYIEDLGHHESRRALASMKRAMTPYQRVNAENLYVGFGMRKPS